MSAALAGMDAEVKFLLETAKVPEAVIAKIGSLGYTSVDVLSKVGGTLSEVREFIAQDLTFNPTASPTNRRVAACILSCWEACNKRSSAAREEEAQQRREPVTLREHRQHVGRDRLLRAAPVRDAREACHLDGAGVWWHQWLSSR